MTENRTIGTATWALLSAVLCACPAGVGGPIVDDVSQLNPIRVERVVAPTGIEEVQSLVRDSHGPISIGGARHSMGGQIASEGALFLDVWRNYEASADFAELEPASRRLTTYVLEEYFVPVERFDAFVPRMAAILRRHRANVINVSVRHALRDPGSLLAWAKQECFSFVIYFKQGTSESARAEVGEWTRELTDAALALDGSYCLPYQIHATREQFLRAYPRAPEFFALKRRLDPDDRFRNQLWDRYDRPQTGRAPRSGPSRSLWSGDSRLVR